MINEIRSIEPVVELEPRYKSTAAERRDGAERVARHRAKKQLELAGLTEKKKQNLRTAAAVALAADAASAAAAARTLTPEQKAIMGSDVFQNGLPDGSSAGFCDLRRMMFEVILAVDIGLFEAVRADWVMEFYEDFTSTFTFAKALVTPRARYYGKSLDLPVCILDRVYGLHDTTGKLIADFDPDWPTEYTIRQFLASVDTWRAHSRPVSVPTMGIEPEPEAVKRPRMRRLKPTPKPAAEPIDPAIAKAWSIPPAKPQTQHWNEIETDRAARAIENEIASIQTLKPPAF